ncbi:hypothetical protein [Martelella limonii]|uniref:hypothetical protein n=1 Tax=Martelella limonii TaxID=1647649 RepID=UPI0015800D7D|nr:hypothetical protein [Martelella limonii]
MSMPKSSQPSGFEEADQATQDRWIRNLLGNENAERFNRVSGQQRFRPTPVRVHFEYFLHDGLWVISRFQNGQQEQHASRLSEDECRSTVNKLRAAGYTVRETRIGFHDKTEKPVSERMRNIDRLGLYRERT